MWIDAEYLNAKTLSNAATHVLLFSRCFEENAILARAALLNNCIVRNGRIFEVMRVRKSTNTLAWGTAANGVSILVHTEDAIEPTQNELKRISCMLQRVVIPYKGVADEQTFKDTA